MKKRSLFNELMAGIKAMKKHRRKSDKESDRKDLVPEQLDKLDYTLDYQKGK